MPFTLGVGCADHTRNYSESLNEPDFSIAASTSEDTRYLEDVKQFFRICEIVAVNVLHY